MIVSALKDMYDELEDRGFAFDCYDMREIPEKLDGITGCCDYGVLSDTNGVKLTLERLGEVLEVAEKWRVFLVIAPEVKKVSRFWQSKMNGETVGENAIVASFIRAGVFHSTLSNASVVRQSLIRSFSYLQEDEAALLLERAIMAAFALLARFRNHAYEVQSVETNSAQFRQFFLASGKTLSQKNDIAGYMPDASNKDYSDRMCRDFDCIRLTCRSY